MSNELIIVDISYLMHRHKQMIEKREQMTGHYMLSFNGEETARLYFTMKDFSSILTVAEARGSDIVVCCDARTSRKEDSADYKSNRQSLSTSMAHAWEQVDGVLLESKIPTLRLDGFEADDIVAEVVKQTKNKYESIAIFTPDTDLCSLIDESGKVYLCRYKSVYSQRGVNNNGKHADFLHAHVRIDKDSLAPYLSQEWKADIRYNACTLFKSICGDKSDMIAGIKGVGPAGYNKFIRVLDAQGFDYSTLVDTNKVRELLENSRDTFRTLYGSESTVDEALDSLGLIVPRVSSALTELVSTCRLYRCAGTNYVSNLIVALQRYGINSIAQ